MSTATSRAIAALWMTGACLVGSPVHAGHAATTPVETGCPASYEVLTVDGLAAEGYAVPAAVDGAGNGDGLVCGKPYAPRAAEQLCPQCPVPVLYGFRDNDVTG